MTALTSDMTTEDLLLPGSFISTRNVGDVLIGEDIAQPLIEASSSGDDTALRSLLSEPKWIHIMLENPPTIYKERRPREGPHDARKVSARRIRNVERGFKLAVQKRHATVISTLMDFSKRQNIRASEFIAKDTMNKLIADEYAWVWESLASADPDIVNFPSHHGVLVLYEAVRLRKAALVEVLLRFGSDPLHPVKQHITLGTFNSSLMSHAAMAQGPQMTEMLLEHGALVHKTAALHTAAAFGHLDTMRLLIQYGADINETIHEWHGWTPMHFAASKGQVDAIELLEHAGAHSDLKDGKGRKPTQLLEERRATEHT